MSDLGNLGDCFETLPNGKRALAVGDGDSELDVFIQDQVTPPYHYYLMTEDKTDITLTAPVSKDDESINVSPGHGFTAGGEWVVIYEGDLFEQVEVTAVNVDQISVAIPIANDFTTSAKIIRGRINLNLNGSVTPISAYSRIYDALNASVPIDIIGAKITIVHPAGGDFSKFGSLVELGNGIFLRKTNGEMLNLGNYKKNQDFEDYGFSVSFDDRAGGGGEYSTIALISVKDIYGVAMRMIPSTEDYFIARIRDDLTTLIALKIMIYGHFTEGEMA